MFMSVYIFNPCRTLIIGYFKIVCFQELFEGFYGIYVLYIVQQGVPYCRGSICIGSAANFLVLVIGNFSLNFLFDLSTLQL